MEIRGELYKTVEKENLASYMKSGTLDVLATPQMVAWMEEASCMIAPVEPGQTSVGIHVEISHIAPSALQDQIRIESILKKQEGKILIYEVSAYHNDVCIGQGTHKRAIVDIEKFMKKLKSKSEGA